MAFATDTERLLTTQEASAIIGRSLSSVKNGLNNGGLPGHHVEGFWRVRLGDLMEWDATTPRCVHTRRPAYERAADVLAEYGSVTPVELAKLLGVHEGNARKYLAVLATEARAHRHADGEWFPGPASDADKEIAS